MELQKVNLAIREDRRYKPQAVDARVVVLQLGPRTIRCFIHEYGEVWKLSHYSTGMNIGMIDNDSDHEAQRLIDFILEKHDLEFVIDAIQAEKTMNEWKG